MEQTGQTDVQNMDMAGYLEAQQRFILYRTTAVGWQEAGYVLLAAQLTSPAAGLQVPGTAWVEDAAGQYQPEQIYPGDRQ